MIHLIIKAVLLDFPYFFCPLKTSAFVATTNYTVFVWMLWAWSLFGTLFYPIDVIWPNQRSPSIVRTFVCSSPEFTKQLLFNRPKLSNDCNQNKCDQNDWRFIEFKELICAQFTHTHSKLNVVATKCGRRMFALLKFFCRNSCKIGNSSRSSSGLLFVFETFACSFKWTFARSHGAVVKLLVFWTHFPPLTLMSF